MGIISFLSFSGKEAKMIEIKNINYKYKNGKNVLDNISIEIQEGEVIGIIRKKWVR